MKFSLTCLVLSAATMLVAQTQPVPDFQLQDVNPRSPRYPSDVSPRDYMLQVSGYYFGAAH